MLPYGLNQKVDFKKNFGPVLGNLDIKSMSKIDEIDFVEKIYPIYKAIKSVSSKMTSMNKNTIGFVGGALDDACLYDQSTVYLKKMSKKIFLKITFY